jgi:hypothetical protein
MTPGEVSLDPIVIEGLKLTMTGVQLRTNLDGRIRWHQGEIRRMTKQLKSPRSDEEGPYPGGMLEGEIGRAERLIEVLSFIRDYVVPDEIYRLGEFDLRFADLLPDDDPWDCGCIPPGALAGGTPPRKTSEPH